MSKQRSLKCEMAEISKVKDDSGYCILEKEEMLLFDDGNLNGSKESDKQHQENVSEIKEEQRNLQLCQDFVCEAEDDCRNIEKCSTVFWKGAGCPLNEDILQEVVEEEKHSNRREVAKQNGLGTAEKDNELRFDAGQICQIKRERLKRSYLRSELEALRYVDGEELQKRWREICQGLGCSLNEVIMQIVVEEQKHSERREIGKQNDSGTIEKGNELSFDAGQICQKKGERSKRSYSRSELEALRYVNGEEQQKMWREIYQGLGVVAGELDQITAAKHQNKNPKSTNRQLCTRKKKEETPMKSGEVCPQLMEIGFNKAQYSDLTCSDHVDSNENSIVAEEICYGLEDSDDEHDSIQRTAFLVEGEPDFESGPPQDGLEYLRRVRWEAAQIPKVRVAKVDRSKFHCEQTAYMPNIPEIAKCPEHLLPSKHWEDTFLADFSNLRQALADLENSRVGPSGNLLPDTLIVNSSKVPDKQQMLKNNPTVSAILGMDTVSRASMLRACISSLETVTMLSRVDCMWLFSLCAAVDVPFGAEMGGSLRCLLRKCASLLAQKSEPDDEVVMLNMLVTIAGRYFGQSEKY